MMNVSNQSAVCFVWNCSENAQLIRAQENDQESAERYGYSPERFKKK